MTNKPIEKWTVRDFHNYLIAEHERLFGVGYVPYRSWSIEQGLLGSIIGTTGKKGKPGTHDKALIKSFIDKCMGSYKPSANYPGISFGFMWTYQRNYLQQLEKEANAKNVAASYKKESEQVGSDWW